MKQISLIAACIFVTSPFITGQAQDPRVKQKAAPTDPIVRQLKKIDIELDQAVLRGDKAAVARLLADGVIVLNEEGNVVARKPDMLNRVEPPDPNVKSSISADDVQVFTFGSTAIVSSRKTTKYETKKGLSSDAYRETNTYSLSNGRWQLVATQASYGPPSYSAKDVNLDLTIEGAVINGNKNATVVLIEFVDYQCPMCRKFAAETFAKIENDYIKTGRVAFLARNLPSEEAHPLAFGAAAAAQCAASQDKFWEMNHRLLQEPMALKPADLVDHARNLNLDLAKFRTCLDDAKTTASIRHDINEAASKGIVGTPIFFVGVRKPDGSSVKVVRRIQGAYPYEVFKVTLESTINSQNP